MLPNRWDHLVLETLFATELVESGIRRLCTVPVCSGYWPVGHDQMYPLHVGLHSYVTGLERLCKLTIACRGFLVTGGFSSMKSYGHRISELLDAVGALDVDGLPNEVPTRPDDDLDPTLTKTLDRFANGAGRYEHLDSLWNYKADVTTLKTWLDLCGRITPSEQICHLISLREIIVERMRMLITPGHLQGSAYTLLNSLDSYLSELSTAVALRLYEKARWVALTLDAVTYYTHEALPLLGEAVRNIRPPAENFFQYSVAQIEEEQVTMEDLESHFELFGDLGEDEDE